jgi:hypothetical protein
VKKIFSNIDKEQIVHIVLRKEDVQSERLNVIEDCEFLQLAAMRLPVGKKFRPHKHVYCEKISTIAQESWVVITGKVKAFFYDVDDKIIAEEVLGPGDCSITLRGGHTYEILEDNTLVYEYKTGPYLGPDKDKEFI